jgi:hypothetical protein
MAKATDLEEENFVYLLLWMSVNNLKCEKLMEKATIIVLTDHRSMPLH